MAIGLASRIELLFLGAHKSQDTLRLIRKVRKQRKSLLTASESFLLHSLGRAQSQRPGDMAEVGVFEGASARILCEVKGGKTLHLFDTFDGLPQATRPDRNVHRRNQYGCTQQSVERYLSAYPNVAFHPGRFPESARDLPPATFCFVHLDVDLYESTRDALQYFYPLMAPGSILLSHDYSILSGVRQAFDEFLDDKAESLVELPTSQCMFFHG